MAINPHTMPLIAPRDHIAGMVHAQVDPRPRQHQQVSARSRDDHHAHGQALNLVAEEEGHHQELGRRRTHMAAGEAGRRLADVQWFDVGALPGDKRGGDDVDEDVQPQGDRREGR